MSAAESHALRVLSILNQQRALGKLCDAALSTSEGLVRLAHRNILACFSDLFQDMPNVQDTLVVTLKDCPEDGLELLLDFIYTGELPLNSDNCDKVQLAASSLCVPEVIAKCQQFCQVPQETAKHIRGRSRKKAKLAPEASGQETVPSAEKNESSLNATEESNTTTVTRSGRVVTCPKRLVTEGEQPTPAKEKIAEIVILLESDVETPKANNSAGKTEAPTERSDPNDMPSLALEDNPDDFAENTADSWDHDFDPDTSASATSTAEKKKPRPQSEAAPDENGAGGKGGAQCPVCNKTFKSKYYLKVHNRYQHAVNQKKPIDPSIDIKAASKWGSSSVNEDLQTKDGDWKEFPQSGIPVNFNSGHITHHMMESVQGNPNAETEEPDCQTERRMRRGRQLFESTNVTLMQDLCRDNLYHVKATVLGTLRRTAYSTEIVLSKLTGFVQNATCECQASSPGRCSHVAAVLFAINDCKDSTSKESSTSKPCTWNVRRKVGKTPKWRTDAQNPNKKRKICDVMNFDPRPIPLRRTSVTNEEMNSFVTELQTANYPRVSLWETIIPMHYSDYTLSIHETDLLRQKVHTICQNLMPSASGITQLCPGQGEEAWFAECRLRVTASMAKSVITASSDSVRANLLKEKLWDPPMKAASLKCAHAKARRCFEEKFPNITVVKSGLWLNSEYPYLAASPDGLLYDKDLDSHGILKIKYPKSLEAAHPRDFSAALPKSQETALCLKVDGDKATLNPKHACYYQVQMQMGLLKRTWCYVVDWSPEEMTVNKIDFKEDFFDAMVPDLRDFHFYYLCPEYVEMRLPRHLPILSLK